MKNKIEFADHKDDLIKWIIDNNASWKMFIDHCVNDLEQSRYHSNKMWTQCWDTINKTIESKNLIHATNLINRLEDIYTESNDDNIKLRVIEQLRKISGIDASDKVDVNMSGNVKLNWGNTL
jgi:hypothetical protein